VTIDVFAGGGTVLRSHTHVFSGTNEDNEASGTVQLATPAPAGGTTIALASSNTKAASVTAAGQGANFAITTRQVTTRTLVILSATWRGKTVSVKMILQPPPTLQASGASFAAGHVVIFRWHALAGLSSELQVAANPAFTSPVTDVNTNTAHAWAVMSLPSGTLYWRVLGVDVNGAQGPPSAVRTFTIRPPSGPLPAPFSSSRRTAPPSPPDSRCRSSGKPSPLPPPTNFRSPPPRPSPRR
jgi:hypothetical protein